jgi:ribosomal 50S subunit-recycling heat shock protein
LKPSPSDPSRLRLDLFLKRSRLVKRRSLAATLCDNGYILLNGNPSPPGKSVKPGDSLEVRYARHLVRVKVLSLPQDSRKDQECYELLEREEMEDL